MLKHVKLSDYHGLKEFESIFPEILQSSRRKDLRSIGPYTYSSHKGYVLHYFVWNHVRFKRITKLINNSNVDGIEKMIATVPIDESLRHKCRKCFDRFKTLMTAGRSDKDFNRYRNRLISMLSMIGYIELESVMPKWKAQHVQFAFISREARGHGIAKKLYEVACEAGEILSAGEQQTKAARYLWLAIIKSKKFVVWVETVAGDRFVINRTPENELTDADYADENNLIDSPIPIWLSDSVENKPNAVRMYAVAA